MKKKQAKLKASFMIILDEMNVYARAVGYSLSYQKAVRNGVIDFLEWLESEGIIELKKVKRSTIKKYHNYLKNRPNERDAGALSSSMIYNYLNIVRLIFRQQEQAGKLLKNPMSGYVLSMPENKKRTILSQAEIKVLYEVCEDLKERIILDLYYGLGLRSSEGLALDIKDIDFQNGWLYVLKSKGGKSRNMPLTKGIQNDLKAYILSDRVASENTALLLNRVGKRMSSYSANLILKRLLKRAKITKKISLHCLRHSIATHLIENKMPIEQVRNYLGHAHLETTQKYINYDPRRVFRSKIQQSNKEVL